MLYPPLQRLGARVARTLFGLGVALSLGAVTLEAGESDTPPFEPKYRSLEKHAMPTWFEDAKLGIFIHWGLYSVPAFAPTGGKFEEMPEGEFFRNNPYAEWYLNSLNLEGTATARHHAATYGEGFNYYRFAESFNQQVQAWKPDLWAELFAAVHARYVVLTTKHHDGFTLWPSKVPNPVHPEAHANRDLVGELAKAVRAKGLRMGLYYSGGIDWSIEPHYISEPADGGAATPGGAYPAYADAHLRELIAKVHPSILWNDIRYPQEGSELLQILADFYNQDPDGVINDRWGGHWVPADFKTAEYKVLPDISAKKWETNRGIGNSFGYNREEGPEHLMSIDELVDSFIDIVSKNGNLLLNLGPRADGSLPEMQVERLQGLGRWLDTNGAAIFGTRPWVAAEGRLREDAARVRFTFAPAANGTGTVFVHLLDAPAHATIVLEDVVPAAEQTQIQLLGVTAPLRFRRLGDALEIQLPEIDEFGPAQVLAITPQPKRLQQK